MAIKLDLQANVVICSRMVPSADGKQTELANVYTVNLFKSPDTLPQEVVEKHNLDADEQQAYADFIQAEKVKASNAKLQDIKKSLDILSDSMIFSTEQLKLLRQNVTQFGIALGEEIHKRNQQQ